MSALNKYRQLFSDILKSYTFVKSPTFGDIIIKHLNNLDISEISYYSDLCLQDALKKGIPSYDEKVEYLIKNNLWGETDEQKIKDNKTSSYQFSLNKSNEHLKSKRDFWIKEIEKIDKEIRALEYKKQSLIGDTAEGFANKKSNELHVLYSFFKDKEFKIPRFSQEEFDEFDQSEINNIFNIFGEYMDSFSTDSLKKISLSPFFLNIFYMAGDNVFHFYGKPIIELSFYQADLWQWGMRFKRDLQEFPNIPPDIMSDPDKILEYVELNSNYNKRFPKDENGEHTAGTVVGATKNDLKLLGIEQTANNSLNDALKKGGGKLSMGKLLELQGE